MPVDLNARSPRVGDTLRLQGTRYEVTGVSRYKNDEGYSVVEWCCETDDSECYLLRETKEGEPPRWFFTRWIEPGQITIPGGEAPPRWEPNTPPPQPPKALMRQGDIFQYADTTDGQYEDDDGLKQRKITWDYWNAGKTRNVAVELWADGGFDFYTGAYIQPAEAAFEAGGSARDLVAGPGASPWAALGLSFAACYLLLMIMMGWPFDQCFAGASIAAIVITGLMMSSEDVAPALSAGAIAAALTVLFVYQPPFSTPGGLAGLLLGPVVVAVNMRARQGVDRRYAVFLCAATAAAPAAAIGFWHYFKHAPGPHTLDQMLLSLVPALVGGLFGAMTATFLRPEEASAS